MCLERDRRIRTKNGKERKEKMLGMNKVEILGNLGGTPELRFLNGNNDQVVNFSVAVNERYRNRQNELKDRLTWFRVIAFNGLGQVCAEHLRKGDGLS